MDTTTLLMGVGLLLLFVAPIIYLLIAQKGKQNKKFRKLQEINQQHNLASDAIEETGLLLLGLDSKAQKLIVVEPINNYNFMIVDLREIKSCRLKTADLPQRPGRRKWISLELIEGRTDKKGFEVIFYDEDETVNIDPDVELLKARKWQGMINNCLAVA